MKIKYKFSITIVKNDFLVVWWFSIIIIIIIIMIKTLPPKEGFLILDPRPPIFSSILQETRCGYIIRILLLTSRHTIRKRTHITKFWQHIVTHGTVHIVKSTRYLKWNSTQRVNVYQSKHAIHLFKDSVYKENISRYTIIFILNTIIQ